FPKSMGAKSGWALVPIDRWELHPHVPGVADPSSVDRDMLARSSPSLFGFISGKLGWWSDPLKRRLRNLRLGKEDGAGEDGLGRGGGEFGKSMGAAWCHRIVLDNLSRFRPYRWGLSAAVDFAPLSATRAS
ncbi:MAG: hypothetical protein ABW032_11025, partial [Burkholderiaceae bacterium]